MNTDRELLELAAKAADVGSLDFEYPTREGHGFYMGPRLPMPQGVLMAAMWEYWDPLTNDGDAMRLAVKLRLDIYHYPQIVAADFPPYVSVHDPANENGGCDEELGSDPRSAVRRAIVRAAAEIGRTMS